MLCSHSIARNLLASLSHSLIDTKMDVVQMKY